MAKSKMLTWVAAAVLAAIGNCSAFAADDHVKIGVLTDLTGPYSAITGKGSVAAARLAIEDFGGSLLGKPIELVVADHTSKPDIGANLARQWYQGRDSPRSRLIVDGVDAIFDGAGSSVALAILEIARSRSKIVAFAGVISPDVTGKLCGETISSWAWDTHAMVATSLESLMKLGASECFS
jgi:branched-chain amino acid transport system substrate-binding protein